MLALSIAFAKAMANHKKVNLYDFLSINHEYIMPVPMINIINGGAHADNKVDIQEFMIAQIGAPSFSEAIIYGCELF